MNRFTDSAIWFMEQERAREESRRRNQNILDRQLFRRAEERGLISIDGQSITVLDPQGARAHFSHHPELVDMCPGLGWALNGDLSRLEPSLAEVWRQVSSYR